MFESSREGVPATTAVGITPLPNVELHLMREKGAIKERVLECSGLWRCERTTAVGSLRLAQGIVVMEECFNTMRVQHRVGELVIVTAGGKMTSAGRNAVVDAVQETVRLAPTVHRLVVVDARPLITGVG